MGQISDTFNTLARTAYFGWWEDCFEGAERPAVIQYDIADAENGGTWYAVIDNQRPTCAIHEGPAKSFDLRLRLAASDWLDIIENRRTAWSLLASRKIAIDGDRNLIGVLDLLGLFGSPVTANEVAAHERDRWIARAPSFVVPRVLAGGAINHDKWRYFVGHGELRAIVSHLTWRVWRDPRASRYASELTPILRHLWWRSALIPSPRHWLPVGLVSSLLVISAFVLAPWWVSLTPLCQHE